MIFSSFEDPKKNLLAQAFFSYFPSKTICIIVKQLKQTEYNTEVLFSAKQEVILRKCLENYTLKALKMNENSEIGYTFRTKIPKPKGFCGHVPVR